MAPPLGYREPDAPSPSTGEGCGGGEESFAGNAALCYHPRAWPERPPLDARVKREHDKNSNPIVTLGLDARVQAAGM